MLNNWSIILISLGYMGLLFFIAWLGDRRPERLNRSRWRPIIYGLGFAVHTTTWGMYGTIGQTVQTGWITGPTYIGGIIVMLLMGGFLAKMLAVGHRQHITSIADFISARYGKSQSLAVFVTVVAIIGVTPYIALQLKALAVSFNVLAGAGEGAGWPSTSQPFGRDTALFVAVVMALFSILFGTRRIVSSERHEGMMLAIAFETLVKLTAFLAVGLFVTFGLYDGFLHISETAALEGIYAHLAAEETRQYSFLTSIFLGGLAIFCLPRSFHVMVVENNEAGDLKQARWVFAAFLLLMGIFIWPIASAGLLLLPEGANPEMFILELPLMAEKPWLALFVYIGGLSAATSMVIVSSVALSIMICNDVVMPFLLRLPYFTRDKSRDFAGLVRLVRRLAIVGILALAYIYYRLLADYTELASFGLLSMALLSQFAPSLIGGLYWKAGHRRGVMAGLVMGFGVCLYTLLLPELARSGLIDSAFLQNGPFGLRWLRPEALMGIEAMDRIGNGLFWSLLVNTGGYVFVSLRSRPNLVEHIQAASFTDHDQDPVRDDLPPFRSAATNADLQTLAERFIGEEAAQEAFRKFARDKDVQLGPADKASSTTIHFTERLLAGAIGSASARVVLRMALEGRDMGVEDFVSIVDEASSVFKYNRDLLQSSMDNVSPGISVVDHNLRLVAWNKSYEAMFGYPEGFLYEGRHVADLLRYNAEQGQFGDSDPQEEIRKRLAYMEQGSAYTYQRWRRDGTVIEMRGKPMPGGGFVTSYTDITEFKKAEQALKEANETLEQRVRERTRALTEANKNLILAKQEADRANKSKTRFLAAVSHDVLQPLNAAKLFATALAQQNYDAKTHDLIDHLHSALNSVEDILREVLDISKLESGAIRPEVTTVSLRELFDNLSREFLPLFREKGLELRTVGTDVAVRSDRQFLRRILQNFLSNALNYTRAGKVLLGCRRAGPGHLRLEVWDMGPGIPESHREAIFGEFQRLDLHDNGGPKGAKGLGLGLAIVRHMSRILDHPVTLRSWPGQGSVFAVTVPLDHKAADPVRREDRAVPPARLFAGAEVICLDNDPAILRGMEALLEEWGLKVICCRTEEEFMDRLNGHRPGVILADYHLDGARNGLDILADLKGRLDVPCIVISADQMDHVKKEARRQGYYYLSKPLKAASLRALLNKLLS
ncbi:PAS domain-containing hybrid sensor histidine kinase/response regulator [Luteithermobacter gelatinilyticus]|uniref:PAS domain-containing hybrid sensor histidine kinase/response regulator n=1 Tax=Luteithermobacter gelatinilyticus TaxID=2582913 RepID=UPI0011063BF0|nr:PAS domain-containing hybrid sensor histidine kinase/response regulator [Luteithermobacter gelatinilyticus]